MANVNRSPAMLATVSAKLGTINPTIDQRLCDALFDLAIAGRSGITKTLWERASLRVARDLELAVFQSRKRTDRVWKFTPLQRRALAEQIRTSVFKRSDIDNLIRQRSRKLIRHEMWTFNERHYDLIDVISNNNATDGATGWLLYCADKAAKCSNRDRDRLKKRLYTCWTVAYAVERCRELCL